MGPSIEDSLRDFSTSQLHIRAYHLLFSN